MAKNLDQVKELRDRTGCGLMDCKHALAEANDDLDKAIELLRKKSMAKVETKATRATLQGGIGFYQHHNGMGGAMVEVNCETDFVARTPEFQALLRDLSQHVYAASPQFVARAEVSEARVAAEREIYKEQVKDKPAKAQEKIIAGKVDGFFKDVCLLEQPFVKDPKKSIEQLVKDAIARLGENISIRRFARLEVGVGK